MISGMKTKLLNSLAFAALVLAGAAVHAAPPAVLKAEQAWARPTVAGQQAGGAYVILHNGGATADRLLGGSTPAAERVEVHEMRMDGSVMRMRELAALELPAGKSTKLEPGGRHLMLMGLKAPLKVGDKVPLKLRFEKAGEIEVVLLVQTRPAAAADAHKH